VRLLVAEQDGRSREALRRTLALAGYEVQTAHDGEHALEELARRVPDAVLLDASLPGIDGLEVCRRARRLGNDVPIMMLAARDDVAERIDGLEVGADDYMVKPFDVRELRARVHALLRRSRAERGEEELSFAEVVLDPARHGARVGETFVELTRTEYLLLELLLLNSRRVLTHAVIYDRVWGDDLGPRSNSLRVYVGYLRRKLAQAGARPLIHTVRGVGYALREP
jgi:two-component system response regulator MprA